MLHTPSPGAPRRWLLAASLLMALGSCADQTPAADRNDCGGTGDLTFEAKAAAPGDGCGVCGEGRLVCDGQEALRCEGARDHTVQLGAACGPCDDGTYQCADTGDLVCLGASANNACGGCAELSQELDTACEVDGEAGRWQCAGTDQVACVSGPGACGGDVDPEPLPGTPCGACSLGRAVCDGPTAVACEGETEGLNACDSCGELSGAPGEACGECGGELVCFRGGLVCHEPARNRCGGCGPLAGNPGDACDDGFFVCTPDGDVTCQPSAQATNACGGIGSLDTEPGEACGACGDGWTVCASPELVVCSGAREANACGGCGPMQGIPGELCGAEGWAWTCTSENTLTCADVREADSTGLLIEPAELELSAGQQADLVAWLLLPDDLREDRTAEASWETSDEAIATIDAGRLSAVAPGTVTITARHQGHVAELVLVIEPNAATLVSLSLAPSTLVLATDETGTLQALAHYDDGTEVPFDEWVTWTVANPATATASAGAVTGLAEGTTEVTVTFQEFSATATVEVKPAYESLVVSADPSTVFVGGSLQLLAMATRPDHSSEDVTARVAWTVSPPEAGSVDDTGLFTASAVGLATVEGRLAGLTASVELEVKKPAAVALRLEPETLRLEPGAVGQLRALAELEDGSEEDVTAEAAWLSTDAGKATVEGGLVTAVSSGSVEIRASYEDLSASAQVQIPMGTVIALHLSPGVPLRLTVGACVSFEATAVMSEGEPVSATQDAAWSVVGDHLSPAALPARYCIVAAGSGWVMAELDGQSATVEVVGVAAPSHLAASEVGTVLRHVTAPAHFATQPDTATVYRRTHSAAHFAVENTSASLNRRTYPASHFVADPRSHNVERP